MIAVRISFTGVPSSVGALLPGPTRGQPLMVSDGFARLTTKAVGDLLEAVHVRRPVGLRHVVVALPHPDRAVGELPDDVGVPGVPLRLGDHVHEHLVQGRVPALLRPPRHGAGGVQVERVDRRVGVRPDPAVEGDDLLAALLGGRPHVGVGLRVVVQPRQGLAEGPAEDLAEVARLDARDVLHQPQQVGAGRGERTAGVELRGAVQLPEQVLAAALQVEGEIGLRGIGHEQQSAEDHRHLPTSPSSHRTARQAGTSTYRTYRRRTSAPLEASSTVRWEEPRDPDQPPPPRRWGVAVAVPGLGIALVTGATVLPGSPPPPAHGGTATAGTVDEPTGRGGLSHRAPIAPTTAPAPAPEPVAAAPVAEAAATSWATTSVPAAAPLVARAGQA